MNSDDSHNEWTQRKIEPPPPQEEEGRTMMEERQASKVETIKR